MPRHVGPALGLGLSLILFATIAGGQPPGERPALDAIFKRFDTNGDGKLSRAEFDRFAEIAPKMKGNAAAADAAFKRLDPRGTGFVSLDEFKKQADLAPDAGKGKGLFKKNPFAPKGKDQDTGKTEPAPKILEKVPTAEELAFFEKKIRPVLIAQCYECHSAETKKGPKGGLALDTKASLREGGDSGPALVLGHAKKSLLIQALKGDGVDQMPPKEKLSADVIADFERWVAMGAPDPRTTGGAARKAETIDLAQGKKHWSFQPVTKPEVPKPGPNSPSAPTPIDAFILAQLAEKNLTPTVPADKRTLIRRVYFDLIGLPPTPQQVEAFVADPSPTAFEAVVDSLLASAHFGERWGRHWLDVARYAESSGKEQNVLYPHAWRYRDYVIAAFNADKPYDQFLREQLAGDLLPATSEADRAENLTATGFLAIGPKSHNERDPLHFRLDLADEQIDAFSQAMLGLTIACARCHDHKFDPIPTRDYYALAGIFQSTETKFGTAQIPIARNAAPLQELPSAAPTGVAMTAAEIERTKSQLEALKKQREEAIAEARKDGMAPVRLVVIGVQIGVLERQLANYTADGKPKALAMAAGDKTFARNSPIYLRGEPEKPGEVVPRGFLQVLSTTHDPSIRTGSGRKELAEWVTAKTNPLTARVMVNRVWQHLFGRGLVSTPDNFGTTGQRPSHPMLLDYLASEFQSQGWSIKKLIRSIVLTQAYQRSSANHDANAAIDPENIQLWRMSKRRLDAEVLRDAMYAVSGQLNTTPMTGSAIGKLEGPVQVVQRTGGLERLTGESLHRSVYLPVVRDQIPEVLELFDFAEPSLVTGSREDTSVPSQALFLMNNPQVLKLAEKTAERLLVQSLSDSERIDQGFRLAYGRPPTPTETQAAERFLTNFLALESRASRRKTDVQKAAWAAFAQALFAAAEFRYVD